MKKWKTSVKFFEGIVTNKNKMKKCTVLSELAKEGRVNKSYIYCAIKNFSKNKISFFI